MCSWSWEHWMMVKGDMRVWLVFEEKCWCDGSQCYTKFEWTDDLWGCLRNGWITDVWQWWHGSSLQSWWSSCEYAIKWFATSQEYYIFAVISLIIDILTFVLCLSVSFNGFGVFCHYILFLYCISVRVVCCESMLLVLVLLWFCHTLVLFFM